MPISASDIAFVYSGGPDNNVPDLSLGGLPSGSPILGDLDNLFGDIDKDRALKGYTDFRCFYVFNDSPDSALYDTKVFIATQVAGGSTADIGFLLRHDQQAVSVQGPATTGTLTLSYDLFPLTVTFDQNPKTFAINLQSALNATANLSGVVCVGLIDNGAITVQVSFEGSDGNKYHPILGLVSNNVTGSTGVAITKLQDGSPINSIAPSVTPTAAPPGVVFGRPSQTQPIALGTIHPGEGFPVWCRRVTPINADGVRYDGFKFQLLGSPTPVLPVVPPPLFSYDGDGIIDMGGTHATTLHGPGWYETEGNGDITIAGSTDIIVSDSNDNQIIYISMSGGIVTGGVSDVHTYLRFLYRGVGGTLAENITYGTATPHTTGIDFIPLGQIFYCQTFPISWFVGYTGIHNSPPGINYCGCSEIPGGSRLDFDPITTTWKGPFGPSQVNGSPRPGKYLELAYNTVAQTWNLKSHYPYDEINNNFGDCHTIDCTWDQVNWNCCGVNSLTNARPGSGFGSNACIVTSFVLEVHPVSYCNPAPFQYFCGKCARENRVPDTIRFSTTFGVGSSCAATAFAGDFLLQRFTAQQPCYWIAEIPNTNISWLMEYSFQHRRWQISLYDPTFTHGMVWTVSDRDFNCCGLCTAWQLDELSTFPCTASTASAQTYPVGNINCTAAP